MSTHHIRYDLLTQEALRGMVRKVLQDAARIGLPGDHHFFISFRTQYPGVSIPVRLAEKFPEEITIVLQHQFWDLTVSEQGFEVGLSFGNAPERLVVPFAALTAFFDPSVEFGVKFEEMDDEDEEDVSDPSPSPIRAVPDLKSASEPVKALPAKKVAKSKALPPVIEEAGEPVEPEAAEADAIEDKQPESEKIVSLDHFRKKK